jgi:hypothetical protein
LECTEHDIIGSFWPFKELEGKGKGKSKGQEKIGIIDQ